MKRTLITIGIILSAILALVFIWNISAYRDIDELKLKAPEHLVGLGYTVDGYNGFHGGLTYGGSVYYLCHRNEQPSIIYEIEVVEWRGEIQSYVPTIVNENIVMNN